MASGQIEVLNPIAHVSVKELLTTKGLDTLAGKIIGICETNKNWRGYNLFTEKLEDLLLKKYGVSRCIRHKAGFAAAGGYADQILAQTEQEHIREFASAVNCVIVGGGF